MSGGADPTAQNCDGQNEIRAIVLKSENQPKLLLIARPNQLA